MRLNMLFGVAVASALALTGCATIFKGTSQVVSINSNVRGADVTVDGKVVGQTPYNGPIKRGSGTTVTVSKEGYQPTSVVLNTEFENIFWGNILIGGTLGSSTDFGTGAMYKYSPANINIDLVEAGK